MNKRKVKKVAVHCIVCGKNFDIGGNLECGGTYNGKKLCKTDDIKREFDRQQHKGEGE